VTDLAPLAKHFRHLRFTRYRVATPRRLAVMLNRYPSGVIGAAVIVGSHCYSLTWATPA
jgi:hypothetical protein